MVDSTVVRAHRSASSAGKKGALKNRRAMPLDVAEGA